MKCVDCSSDEDIVYSGVDAFVLGVTELTEQICYPCANKRVVEREEKADE
jgi:hypothetical protein